MRDRCPIETREEVEDRLVNGLKSHASVFISSYCRTPHEDTRILARVYAENDITTYVSWYEPPAPDEPMDAACKTGLGFAVFKDDITPCEVLTRILYSGRVNPYILLVHVLLAKVATERTKHHLKERDFYERCGAHQAKVFLAAIAEYRATLIADLLKHTPDEVNVALSRVLKTCPVGMRPDTIALVAELKQARAQ